jgi:hypothetical protein
MAFSPKPLELRKLSDPSSRFAHVFEGGGYGVAVTAASVEPVPWPSGTLPPGAEERPARLGEMLPVAARTAVEVAMELERVTQAESVLAAYKVELVAALARQRPDSSHAPDDDPLPGVSEFFPDELALALNCSRAAATTLAEHSLTLLERLPATWAALADGELDWPRARALAKELGWAARETDPAVVAEVEAAVLPGAMESSVTRLVAATRRELLALDATAAERRRKQAEHAADVTLHGAADGMAELRVFLPAPLAAPMHEAIDTYARMARDDGDPRPIGQLRVGMLADLVLRPWDDSRPAVTAAVTITAPLPTLTGSGAGTGSVEPGEVDGHPITAGQLRALLADLDSVCPGGLRAPLGGRLDIAIVEPSTGAFRAVVTRSELERLVRRGCADHPDGSCGCPVLDPPGAVDRYRPTPAQYRHVRTRDRSCRHPGCRSRAAWADLDHVVPHGAGGPTDCANLCCLCRRHHRLKTHARGWRFVMCPDGVLSVTTPSGVTRTTRPPGTRPSASSPGPPPRPAIDEPPPF